MRYINHLSDFQVIINIKDKDGNIIAPPSVPWEAVFADENECEFTCSYDGTNYTHCIVDFSDIVCFIDNPGFSCGKLRCTFTQHVPSEDYCDGMMDLSQPLQCDIMLSKRESDDSTPITIEASPNWVKGPQGEQGIQGIQGEKGADGFSPIVSLSKVDKVTTLTITDVNGEHTTEIYDGGASSPENEKYTVWSNPRIDEFVESFKNGGYNNNGTLKSTTGNTRSWVFKIGNYGHNRVYFSVMNAWICDGLDADKNLLNPILLGLNEGNYEITAEHIGKYVVAMEVSGNSGYLGTDYGRCVLFRDKKTQAELDADDKMLSDMYAGNLMRYAVATSGISDTPTLEWGNGAYLKGVLRNIFLDIVSRPNIGYECKVVKKLDCLYQGCGRLIEITPLWDTSLVTTMRSAFQMCRALRYADLSHLNLDSVTDARSLFSVCVALIDAKLPSLPSVTNCQSMFSSCFSLQSIVLPELPAVTNCQSMFSYCSSLQSIVLPEIPSVTQCASMFRNCSSLQSITLPSLQSVTSCREMFYNCSSLQSIVLPELPAVTQCASMFRNCSSLQSITLPSLQSVTSCREMFYNCSSLQSLYLDIPNCEDFTYSFNGCNALHTIEIVDVRKATGLVNSFYLCSSLQNITCVEELPKCGISFSYSSKLTLESVTNIITHLPDLSAEDSKTLTLNKTTKGLLTEALIAEATSKNWIIA